MYTISSRRRLTKLLISLPIIATILIIYLANNQLIHIHIQPEAVQSSKPHIPSIKKSTIPTIPLCLVTTWEKTALPSFFELMLESVSLSGDYVKLFLFTHSHISPVGDSAVKEQEEFKNKFPNVQVIALESLDERYLDEGFNRFLTDRLCEIFHVGKEDPRCKRLFDAMKYSQKSTIENSPAIVQLRGLFGVIFSKWISSTYCDAWAWTDMDVVFGDLRGWLEGNSFVWGMDIFTFGGIDWMNVYTRGQFTAHVQRNGNELVNDVWRYCKDLSTIDAMTETFFMRKNCMDEGCYADAVIQSQLKFLMLPWQGNVYDHRLSSYIFMTKNEKKNQNYLFTAANCTSSTECRRLIKNYLRNSTTIQLDDELARVSGKNIRNFHEKNPNMYLQDGKKFVGIHSKKIPIISRLVCMWWIADEYQTCGFRKSLPDEIKKGQSAFGILHSKNELDILYWPSPLFDLEQHKQVEQRKANNDRYQPDEDEKYFFESEGNLFPKVHQSIMFHFSHWKTSLHYSIVHQTNPPSNEVFIAEICGDAARRGTEFALEWYNFDCALSKNTTMELTKSVDNLYLCKK